MTQEIDIANVEKRVIKVLNDELPEVSEVDLQSETDIVKAYNLDELDIIELWMEIESEFEIAISDEEIEKVTLENKGILTPLLMINTTYKQLTVQQKGKK
jgi:acyl carrier protein